MNKSKGFLLYELLLTLFLLSILLPVQSYFIKSITTYINAQINRMASEYEIQYIIDRLESDFNNLDNVLYMSSDQISFTSNQKYILYTLHNHRLKRRVNHYSVSYLNDNFLIDSFHIKQLRSGLFECNITNKNRSFQIRFKPSHGS